MKLNKLNSGVATIISIGSMSVKIDGYISKDICKGYFPKKFLESLTWTNNLGETDLVLSEATFLEGDSGDVEVFIEEIDPHEKLIFNPLTSAIQMLVQWYKINKKGDEIK